MAEQFKRYDPKRSMPHSDIAFRAVKSWTYRTFEGLGTALVLWSSAKVGREANGYGNGKTMLAKCAANALYETLKTKLGLKDISGVFTTTADFLSSVKNSYDDHSTAKYFGQLKMARFLILDDFGTEYFTDLGWMQEQFFKVLNFAYDTKQPLLMTSNLTIEEMQDRLGGKNWSRLYGLARNGQNFVNMSAIPDQRKGNQ